MSASLVYSITVSELAGCLSLFLTPPKCLSRLLFSLTGHFHCRRGLLHHKMLYPLRSSFPKVLINQFMSDKYNDSLFTCETPEKVSMPVSPSEHFGWHLSKIYSLTVLMNIFFVVQPSSLTTSMAFLASFAIFALILALIRLRILNEVDQSSDSCFLIF